MWIFNLSLFCAPFSWEFIRTCLFLFWRLIWMVQNAVLTFNEILFFVCTLIFYLYPHHSIAILFFLFKWNQVKIIPNQTGHWCMILMYADAVFRSVFIIFERSLKFLFFLHRVSQCGNHPTKPIGISKVIFRWIFVRCLCCW